MILIIAAHLISQAPHRQGGVVMADVAVAAAAPILRETRARKTPMERIEYAIIVSTLLLLVVITVQPILNLIAVSFSDPGQVAGMSGLAVMPAGLLARGLVAAAPAPQRSARHPQLDPHHRHLDGASASSARR